MKMNNFILVTICSRPQYLKQIYDDIVKQNYSNFKWIICFDSNEKQELNIDDDRIILLNHKKKKEEMTNYAGLNYVLDYIKENNIEGFIHIIDDDNSIYPNYFNVINNTINDTAKFLYYQQSYPSGEIRFLNKTNNLREGQVDTAQVTFHTSIVNELKFNTLRYTADGLFYGQLFATIRNNKSLWQLINQPLCFYNSLVDFSKIDSLNSRKNLILVKKSKTKTKI